MWYSVSRNRCRSHTKKTKSAFLQFRWMSKNQCPRTRSFGGAHRSNQCRFLTPSMFRTSKYCHFPFYSPESRTASRNCYSRCILCWAPVKTTCLFRNNNSISVHSHSKSNHQLETLWLSRACCSAAVLRRKSYLVYHLYISAPTKTIDCDARRTHDVRSQLTMCVPARTHIFYNACIRLV